MKYVGIDFATAQLKFCLYDAKSMLEMIKLTTPSSPLIKHQEERVRLIEHRLDSLRACTIDFTDFLNFDTTAEKQEEIA